MTAQIIDVGKDFSRYPAGRSAADGPFSGELFRDKYLYPAIAAGRSISVHLDSTAGYGSSFLEEAFGGLIRRGLTDKAVKSHLTLVSDDDSLIAEILSYIDDEVRRGRRL